MATPGIFCLEGPWSSRLTDPLTVKPMLDMLQLTSQIKYLHDRVHTKGELLHLLRKWGQKGYSDYPIGYFAFHGDRGVLNLGRGQKVSLQELGDELEGKLAGRVVHFGSCRVMQTPDKELQAFRDQTGAKGVMGYRRDVDWMMSAAFELLVFDAFTKRTQMRGIETWIRDTAGGLAEKLGFRLYR